MRCMLCGRQESYGGISTRSGVFLCYEHQDQPLCLWCGGLAVGSRVARPVCVGCRRTLVATEQDAFSFLGRLELFLKDIDVTTVSYTLRFRSDSDVWIDGLTATQVPHVVGSTMYQEATNGPPIVEVALGMPRVEFMAVLAHEVGHVMLAPYEAARNLPLRVQEGLSEVIGEAFAATCEDAYAVRRLRARLRQRTDPVYGRGYAEVSARARLIGLKGVIEEVSSARW